MFKKILLFSTILLMSSCTPIFAESLQLSELIGKMPDIKQGFAWSLQDSKLNALSTIEVTNWKKLNLEVGAAGDGDSTDWKAVGVLSLDLLDMQNVIKFPILDKIVFRPGIYIGWGSINSKEIDASEFDYGVSATILDIKF